MSSLAQRTTLRLGGAPRSLVDAHTEAQLIDAVAGCDAAGEAVFVLGGGSNLVAASGPIDTAVVAVKTRGVTWRGDTALVAAGHPWDAFVEEAVDRGLYGVESLSGIPGTVGATPIQNVGAYGQEVAEVITAVRCYDRVARAVVTLDNAACGFRYRDSAFKSEAPGRYVVLSVDFALRRAAGSGRVAGASPAEVRASVLAQRRAKAMVLDPDDPDTVSAGSFFTNPFVTPEHAAEIANRAVAEGRLARQDLMPRWPEPDGRVKLAAGWLIEQSGLGRGFALHPDAGARLSTRHALALTHQGGGSEALIALARHVRATVRARWGVDLVPEPVFLGFSSADPTRG